MQNLARHVTQTIEAETRFRLDQAARAAFRDDTALANWFYLFETGQYRKARAWWFSAVEPRTRQEPA